eukprot:3539029-Amphidinium_carterae.1
MGVDTDMAACVALNIAMMLSFIDAYVVNLSMFNNKCCLMGPSATPRRMIPMRTSSANLVWATDSYRATVRSKSSSLD